MGFRPTLIPGDDWGRVDWGGGEIHPDPNNSRAPGAQAPGPPPPPPQQQQGPGNYWGLGGFWSLGSAPPGPRPGLGIIGGRVDPGIIGPNLKNLRGWDDGR